MPLVRGTTTADRRVPASNTYTLSHNHNVGADGYLFVVITCPFTDVSSVTYAGVAMTLVQRKTRANTGSYNTDWTVWRLAAPATGANNLVVRMVTSQFNGVSTFITSYTGCAGSGNIASNLTISSPVTTSVAIEQNSMIIGSAIGGNSLNLSMQIPTGTSLTLLYSHNANNWAFGSVSPSLGAGTISCRADSNGSTIMMLTEVREAPDAPVVNNTSGWWMILN
jgi:hypothetical protein